MSETGSYRQVVRSTWIIGGATLLRVLTLLLRTKVVALLLGPTGVGLIGLFQSVVDTGSQLFSLGLNTAGARQIARSSVGQDTAALHIARRALAIGAWVLALAGGTTVYMFRHQIATRIANDSAMAGNIGWLAAGVSLTVIAGAQGAILTGLRRIGDIARISVFAALLSTALGVAAVLAWQEDGAAFFVIAAPLSAFLLGQFYVFRLPASAATTPTLRQLLPEWSTLGRLGFTFMLASLVESLGTLIIRSMLQHELGLKALGQFQAAWMMSIGYIGLVLTAMSTDYYPRLAAIIDVAETSRGLVNQQTEIALLLAGPILLIMLSVAPWMIWLLYSREFANAGSVFRWLVFGDLMKIASWPLGFILLAKGYGWVYLASEAFSTTVFLVVTAATIQRFGVQAPGIAFVAMHLVYLPFVYRLARKHIQFRWTPQVRHELLLLLVSMLATVVATGFDPQAGAVAGLFLGVAMAFRNVRRIAALTDSSSRLVQLLNRTLKKP